MASYNGMVEVSPNNEARFVDGTYRSGGLSGSGNLAILTSIDFSKHPATVCASSAMDIASSEPTLYGRHETPL